MFSFLNKKKFQIINIIISKKGVLPIKNLLYFLAKIPLKHIPINISSFFKAN